MLQFKYFKIPSNTRNGAVALNPDDLACLNNLSEIFCENDKYAELNDFEMPVIIIETQITRNVLKASYINEGITFLRPIRLHLNLVFLHIL